MKLEYADVPPADHTIVSRGHIIRSGDMVCFDLSLSNGGWKPARHGQNIVGATVEKLWPQVMAVAVENPRSRGPSSRIAVTGQLQQPQLQELDRVSRASIRRPKR